MAAASVVSQTLNVMQEAVTIFQTADDELKQIQYITSLVKEQRKAWQEEEERLETERKELQARLQELEGSQRAATESKDHATKLEELENQLYEMSKQTQWMEEECNKLSASIRSRNEKIAELEQKQAQAETQVTVENPKAKSLISLYENISGIQWDYNAPALVKGVKHISTAGKRVPKAFRLDPATNGECFIADYLWTLELDD